MPLHPLKRREFIRKLRQLGFSDVQPGAKHAFMRYGNYRQRLPNDNEYSVAFLKHLLQQVQDGIGRSISDDEWNKL
jgi:predicted RNA binding protein YcfA (HicA-like mRNA interferase family)